MVQTITIPASQFTPAAPSPSTFASQPSFAQKILNFQLTVPQTPTSSQPTNFANAQGATPGSYSFSGYRSRCRITYAGAPTAAQADISIWGLDQSTMNELATLQPQGDAVSKNQILVSAGAASNGYADAGNANQAPLGGFPVVFGGTIWFAYGDYGNMPDVAFRISAQAGLINAVQSVAPASFNGSTSIVSIMQSFADQLGIPLENNNVSGSLSNPYYPGTLLQQIYQVADHNDINAVLVDGGTKLAIWPRGGSRTSITNIPLISPDTGMVGYPSFAPGGWMTLKMIFNPDVILGGNIQVESSIPQANKTWTVYKLDLALDSLIANGEWMATAMCYPKGLNAGIPPPPGG